MVFRVGLIGCGNIGARYDEREHGGEPYTHAGMYRAVADFDLCCAAETDPGRRREFGRHWGVSRLYADAAELVEAENPDVVSIATPDDTHAEVLHTVLRSGSPRLVFTEKPLAGNVAAARAIVAECRERDIHLIVDYVRRWDARHRAVRDFLRDGGLGRLIGATGYYVRGIRHNGCQLVNLIRFLMGEIDQVQAVGTPGEGGIPGDPALSVHLRTVEGLDVSVSALDRGGYAFSIFELDIFGGEGRLRLSDGGMKSELWRVDGDPVFTNFKRLTEINPPWPKSGSGFSLLNAGRELAAILGGGDVDPAADAIEAIRDLAVIEAALTSSADGNGACAVPRIE